jgi:hypothetical protein
MRRIEIPHRSTISVSKGTTDALPALAAELVRIPVNVMVTEVSWSSIQAKDFCIATYL